jgi:hypothetical protein
MLAGDVDIGKALLRDYIRATIGFEHLGRAIGMQPKILIRMFGPRGNPEARNLFNVIGYLQKQAGVELRVAIASVTYTHRKRRQENKAKQSRKQSNEDHGVATGGQAAHHRYGTSYTTITVTLFVEVDCKTMQARSPRQVATGLSRRGRPRTVSC